MLVFISVKGPVTGVARANTNPNQLLLYKLYFTMSISNWLVFRVFARAYTDNKQQHEHSYLTQYQ